MAEPQTAQEPGTGQEEAVKPDDVFKEDVQDVVSFGRRVRRWFKKHRVTIGLTIGGILAILFAGWYLWILGQVLAFLFTTQPLFFWTMIIVNAIVIGLGLVIGYRVVRTQVPDIAPA